MRQLGFRGLTETGPFDLRQLKKEVTLICFPVEAGIFMRRREQHRSTARWRTITPRPRRAAGTRLLPDPRRLLPRPLRTPLPLRCRRLRPRNMMVLLLPLMPRRNPPRRIPPYRRTTKVEIIQPGAHLRSSSLVAIV